MFDIYPPFNMFENITKSDTVDIGGGLTHGVWIGGVGNVVFVLENDELVTLTAVPAGTFLPIKVKRINSTNTTATLMVAMYRR